MSKTKMYRVQATMSSNLDCYVNMPTHWNEDQCWMYAREHLDGGSFVEDKDSGDWNTYDCQKLDEDEAMAVMKVVANDGNAIIVDADPTTFGKDPMDEEFEDDDKWFIKFRIIVGDQEFFEYRWVTHKFNRTATNEVLIKEIYSLDELDPIGKEGEQPYWLHNMEHGVEVYHREPINEREYDTLQLTGVLY